jgi:hypothetical protein
MVDQSSVLVVVENERVAEEAPVVRRRRPSGGTATAEAAEAEAAPASPSLTTLEAPAIQQDELGDWDSAATTKVPLGNEQISCWTR